MLHGSISSKSVLLLLLVNFMSGFRLELMYIYNYQAACAVAIAHRNHFLDPRPLNQDLSTLPSVFPSVRKFSWDWLISYFFKTQHGVRGLCGVVCDRAKFLEKKFFAPKIGFFESIGKISHYFFLNLVYKESLY